MLSTPRAHSGLVSLPQYLSGQQSEGTMSSSCYSSLAPNVCSAFTRHWTESNCLSKQNWKDMKSVPRLPRKTGHASAHGGVPEPQTLVLTNQHIFKSSNTPPEPSKFHVGGVGVEGSNYLLNMASDGLINGISQKRRLKLLCYLQFARRNFRENAEAHQAQNMLTRSQ